MYKEKLIQNVPDFLKDSPRWIPLDENKEPLIDKEGQLWSFNQAIQQIGKLFGSKVIKKIGFVTGDGWERLRFKDDGKPLNLHFFKEPFYFEWENQQEKCLIAKITDDENIKEQVSGLGNVKVICCITGSPINEPYTEEIDGLTVHTVPAATDPEMEPQLPEWLIIRQWQGRDIKRIDEPKFAEMFQDEYKVNRIKGVFYVNGKEVQDDYILMLIQKKIAVYFKENTGRLTNNVFITLSNTVYTKQPKPDETKIYCNNGITILVKKDGSFDTISEDLFTLTRIGANYNPAADCPTFKKYLNDLFYKEDIPAVQEYFGYCLIPCTRAQAGLFIKGNGGEGKSVLRDIAMSLFGHSAIQENIHQLGERFTIANLENKLVVVDDDLRSDLLNDTATLKKLITAHERFQVERKQKTKYDAFLYSRIIAIGNTFIGSKFDHSDGFYRRQLLIDVKPKTRDAKDDDRFMSDKCIIEIDGILNWALEGLSRLIKNDYHFSISDRMIRTLDNIKHDGDNSLTFIEDDTFIQITHDFCDQTTTADLFSLYAVYCSDNGDTPIKRKSFQVRMGERFKDYKIRIQTDEGRLQGFAGIQLTEAAKIRLSRINERERDRIARLP